MHVDVTGSRTTSNTSEASGFFLYVDLQWAWSSMEKSMQCAQSITMTTTSPYNGIKYQIIRKLFEDNEMVGGKDTYNASSVNKMLP